MSPVHGPGGGRPAAFLDRDGTLLDELGYLGDPSGVRLLPGAAAAVRRWNEAGVATVVVTNQSGVARGFFDERQLANVHERMLALLEAEGARLDAILYCPHHPEAPLADYRRACDCRKPEPGLFLRAADELGLALRRSWAVGDAWRDVEAARRAGIPGRFLVLTGKGASERERVTDARVVADLAAAAREALGEAQGR